MTHGNDNGTSNDILHNISVTAMTNMGAGVAHAPDDTVIFVDGAADGDIADIEITEYHKKYRIGRIISLHGESCYRQTPDCVSAFTQGCGGCTFRHITYEHELQIKLDYIKSLLRRVKTDIVPDRILTAGDSVTRSKMTVPVDAAGVSGYYRRGSYDIVPSKRCALHSAAADSVRAAVCGMIADGTLTGINELCLRESGTGDIMLILCAGENISYTASDGEYSDTVRCPAQYTAAAENIISEYSAVVSVYLLHGGEYTLISGHSHLRDRLSGCEFLISPASFYQVNHNGAEILYDKVAGLCDLHDGDELADLYCGTGTIGISVIKNSGVRANLTGIEIVPSAVADAERNAAINGVNARFICADAVTYRRHADTVILDPPRAGCGRTLIDYLLKTRPRRIVYVSCDPATFTRDAAILCGAASGVQGVYKLDSIYAVDMFPRTAHVEMVALMTREKV